MLRIYITNNSGVICEFSSSICFHEVLEYNTRPVEGIHSNSHTAVSKNETMNIRVRIAQNVFIVRPPTIAVAVQK
jgi:hypothetical protein